MNAVVSAGEAGGRRLSFWFGHRAWGFFDGSLIGGLLFMLKEILFRQNKKRRTKKISLIVICLIVVNGGCVTYPNSTSEMRKSDYNVLRLFDGPLPESEVAGIFRDRFLNSGRVVAIDDVPLETDDMAVRGAEVLPGPHTVDVSCRAFKANIIFTFRLDADLEAGRFYKIGCKSCFYTNNPQKFAIYMIDADTKKLVSGRSPKNITQWPYYCHTVNDPKNTPKNLTSATPFIYFKKTTTQLSPPETNDIDLENMTFDSAVGNVTFSHKEHAARTDCSSCHPTEPPEKFFLTLGTYKQSRRNKVHELCVGCHKKEVGPSKCIDCHK
jgi:hypothetical protein